MARTSNSYSEAAAILRGLMERIDRVEKGSIDAESTNVYRTVTDSTLGGDTVTTSTDTDASWVWDTSEWDFDEWSD